MAITIESGPISRSTRVEENPASRIAMLHEDNKIERYLDEAELQRLLNVLRSTCAHALGRQCQ